MSHILESVMLDKTENKKFGTCETMHYAAGVLLQTA